LALTKTGYEQRRAITHDRASPGGNPVKSTHRRSPRRLAGAAALVATATTTLLAAAPASAATGSPTYAYTSEAGDYLGQGNAEHYSAATADFVLENYWATRRFASTSSNPATAARTPARTGWST
jgi:hypothetical protein